MMKLFISLATIVSIQNVHSFNFMSPWNTNKPITNSNDKFSQIPEVVTETESVLENDLSAPISTIVTPTKIQRIKQTDAYGIPTTGIIDYIGNTSSTFSRWSYSHIPFESLTDKQLFFTKFNLWRQYPWKKIKGKFIMKLKLGGEIGLEPVQKGFSFGSKPDLDVVDSLQDLNRLFFYSAHDPRVQAIFLEIDRVACGYAKLIELRRAMKYFRDSGKEIIGYCSSGAEKETYISLGCDEFYIPPDGGLDLRGFSGSATFVRGIFEKIGIEPQVQRIGKYKSFGDTFNRTSLSDAQREVISSLLMEASDYWIDQVADRYNKSSDNIMNIWKDTGVKTAYDWVNMGLVSGVRYMDQVETALRIKYRNNITTTGIFNGFQDFIQSLKTSKGDNTTVTLESLIEQDSNQAFIDFDLSHECLDHPRRSIPNQFDFNNITHYINSQKNSTTTTDTTTTTTTTTTSFSIDKKAESLKSKLQIKKNSIYGKFYPAGLYLRKMRKGDRILQGLPYIERFSGPRVGIINAVGGISTGKSGNSANGQTLGSDTLIELIRKARYDSSIRAVVLRVDSPGGSALASDLMWRELRMLSREKPVIASMVDVAASGGYYLSMACDQILAEDLTVTGSIGVVTAKFNAEDLNERIGYTVETLSRGRYAEILSTSRGFTEEEEEYFSDGAQKAYLSFITKAAASRNMTVSDMNEVAQGRVWTGKQAYDRGLVDRIGGLYQAIQLAVAMSDLSSIYYPNTTTTTTDESDKKSSSKPIRIQTLRDIKRGLPLPFGLGATLSLFGDESVVSSINNNNILLSQEINGPLYICDDTIATTDLVSSNTLGISPLFKSLGCGPILSYILSRSELGRSVMELGNNIKASNIENIIKSLL